MVALCLVGWTLDQMVQVQALARELCAVFLVKTLKSHRASLHSGV